MFRELGPDARDLLDVIAFFPQGIDENNLDWLFPTVSDRRNVFDKLCVLSLTNRSNGFITMLAPLRDYLCPKNPTSSLLRTTKERYFSRLSVYVQPGEPGFEEGRWITSEDVNVEHLLDIFTSMDPNSVDVWAACANFMEHLYEHKPRSIVLGPKIEGLPDDHRFKPKCLVMLSRLFGSVGNFPERKRLLTHALKLRRDRGDDPQVAETLRLLSGANRQLGLCKEGIQQVKEASEIYKRLNHAHGQSQSLEKLARLLHCDHQLDAAEETASQALSLLLEKGNQSRVCPLHRLLGEIYHSKGETEKAINHLETARGIASSSDCHRWLFNIHWSLGKISSGQGRFDDAHVHVELAKSYAINSPRNFGHAMYLQARFWYRDSRFAEAESEA